MKKIISGMLALVLVLLAALTLAGCGDGNYPVSVGNFVIDKEPASIVVLDPCAADIIAYMGYDIKMVGRSEQVDQQILQVAPVMGSSNNPDVNQIKASNADVVFAGVDLAEDVKQQLKDSGIIVVTMALAETPKQLETNYLTIGKILGGAITGESKASDSYSKLIDSMERIKTEASAKNKSTALSTVCYLYYENNALRLVTSGTYGDMLLGYTGAVNVAVNIDENNVDADTLRVANPNYVFYADEQTLEAIKNDKVLSKLSALKDNKTLMVTKDEMSRQGFTALETLQKMVDFMYGGKPASGDEPKGTAPKETKPGETKPSESKQTETTAPSESETKPKATEAAEPKSVADKYKINLDGLSLEFDDENDDVKTMQQRLYDLGYVDDKDNITGYYGEVSKKAVEEFQKANGLEVTGQADNDTLVKLFMDDAKKKS